MHSSRKDSTASALLPVTDAHAARRLRVLIVDDEPLFAYALRRLLAPDHEVLVTIGGAAALTALQNERPFDVVFCDVMMPELSGPELYEAVRATVPAVLQRFVFMTGGVFTQAARAFLASVSNPILEKPFSADEMRRLLQRFAEPSDR